jgi:hypothetical protein
METLGYEKLIGSAVDNGWFCQPKFRWNNP